MIFRLCSSQTTNDAMNEDSMCTGTDGSEALLAGHVREEWFQDGTLRVVPRPVDEAHLRPSNRLAW